MTKKKFKEAKLMIVLLISVIVLNSCEKQYTQSEKISKAKPMVAETNGHWENQVGEIINGSPKFTVDQAALLDNINQNLHQMSNLVLNATRLELIKIGSDYFVRAYGEDKSSTILVYEHDGGIYPSDPAAPATNISCTSTDYSGDQNGCYPNSYTSCKPCSDEAAECTKTVSSSSLLLNAETGSIL